MAADMGTAERLLKAGRPLVIGHRGYNVFAPENTLPSFQFALAAGADLVELDYHHSKDGVPIVIHDAELDRTTDAVERWGVKKLRVGAKTATELRTLDAGRWFGPQYAGTRLPLLTEALDLIQKEGVTLIERKGGDAATCVRLLRERNLINQVVVQSFDWAFLKEFHAQAPEQVLGALGPPSSRQGRKLTDAEKVLSREWIAEAKQSHPSVLGWDHQVTRATVDYAHQQGLKVWVYTINEPKQAAELLDLGVDGIITDNPSLIWRAIALGQAPTSMTR
jgi:glycerophosphoryl diester phosphodiesterase